MYYYTFPQSPHPHTADKNIHETNAHIHIPQTSTVAMSVTISRSCEVPVRQEQGAANALNMLRLSPPALLACLRLPLGVGFPFRSGARGFRPATANGFRLRTNRKFIVYFYNKQKTHTFFALEKAFSCNSGGITHIGRRRRSLELMPHVRTNWANHWKTALYPQIKLPL